MTKTGATIGFRTKTAKAIGVALSGDATFLARWNLDLHDESMPATSQPHHEVLEMPWPEAQEAVRRFEDAIDNVATECLRALIDELRSNGAHVAAIGVVGSHDRTLEKIGNRHIRAHAAEGMLFRHSIEVAAKRCRLSCVTFSEREIAGRAARFDDVLRSIGKSAGRPWRADERAAATAALLAIEA